MAAPIPEGALVTKATGSPFMGIDLFRKRIGHYLCASADLTDTRWASYSSFI
jgi:hypothetical protein